MHLIKFHDYKTGLAVFINPIYIELIETIKVNGEIVGSIIWFNNAENGKWIKEIPAHVYTQIRSAYEHAYPSPD